MTKDEALKLALEALKWSKPHADAEITYNEAITAIKEALAQQEQEPVTWRYKIVDVFGRPAWTLKTPKSDTRVLESQPLYTTPPQRKPLTDEEIGNCIDEVNLKSQYGHHHFGWHKQFARAIEAAHGIKGEA